MTQPGITRCFVYHIHPGERMPDRFINDAAKLYSAERAEVIHVLAASNKEKDPIGYTFAVMEMRKGRRCCVISQMCVKKEHRGRGVATQMLRELKDSAADCDVFKIYSIHPAGIMAACRAFCNGINSLDMKFICDNAWPLAPEARGRLFPEVYRPHNPFNWDRSECCVLVDEWVDHAEGNIVLDYLRREPSVVSKEKVKWPMGELPDGCKYMALIENKDKKKGEEKVVLRKEFPPNYIIQRGFIKKRPMRLVNKRLVTL